MGKQYENISAKHQDFIEQQKMFFVGTARTEGRVNISPKGMESFKVLSPNKILWLNLTGSGNETAIHLLENNRMTIMFCSFEEMPMILRLYGQAKAYHRGEANFQKHLAHFPKLAGARQIIAMDVDLVQSSCGFGVPLMEFKSDRDTLQHSCEKKEVQGIATYWSTKNKTSIDGYKSDVIK